MTTTLTGGEGGTGGSAGAGASGGLTGEGSGGAGGNTSQGSGGHSGAGSGGAGNGGSGAAAGSSWRDTLPEDIRAHASLSSFQDLPSFAKAFIHTKEMVGKKGVILPGEKATDADWGEFYKQIGVPTPDKYEIPLGKDAKVAEPAIKWAKEAFAKNGILPKQGAKILEEYAKFEADQLQAFKTAQETASKEQMEGLKKEWGEGYEKELAGAKLAVKEIGGDGFIKFLNKSGMGDHVELIRFAAKAAKLLGEDRLREGGVGTDDASTRQEIQDKMAKIRADGMTNGYYDKKNPNHNLMVQEMERLGKRMTGGR